jgi:hypothetical protein
MKRTQAIGRAGDLLIALIAAQPMNRMPARAPRPTTSSQHERR